MSGSYGVLNQKYNTLLAQTLNTSSGGSQNLNSVLTVGNTTTSSAVFNGTGINNTIVSGNSITLSNGSIGGSTDNYLSLESTRIGIKKPFITINYGTAGQILQSGGSGGSLSWINNTNTVQRGIIYDITTTTGNVTFATPFTSDPIIVLTVNTNGTSTIIPIAVYDLIFVVGTGITGFTWISATTSNDISINWVAYT